MVLEATVGHSKISSFSLQKDIGKPKTPFLTTPHSELLEKPLEKFCSYCPFQNASKDCQTYQSQVKVKLESKMKDMAIKIEEISV